MTMLVLIGLPLGSYLYLKKGFSYRKDALDEMKVEGKIDWNTLGLYTAASSEKVIDPTIIVYAPFYSEDGITELAEDFNNLHKQFGVRAEINFALAGDRSEIPELMRTISVKLRNVLYISNKQVPGLAGHHLIYLVDSQGGIRGQYNRRDRDEMRKLVKHISILLPLEKKQQIELVRKKETRDAQPYRMGFNGDCTIASWCNATY